MLGYSRGEINFALRGVNMDELTLEEIIRTALRGLAVHM